MFKDVLVGTVGKLLQVVLIIAGFLLLFYGLFGGSTPGIIIGIVLLCAGAGIRYALGNIIKVR